MPDDNNLTDLSGEILLDEENETSSSSPIEETNTDPASATPKIESAEEFESVSEDRPVDKKTPSIFSSLYYYPKGIEFSGQESNEEIILLIRRSFVTNIPWISMVLLFSILPILLIPFYSFLLPLDEIQPPTRIFLLSFYYIIIFGLAILKFALWFYHVSYLTNLRIIDFDVHGILLRDVSETRLKLVQEVKYTQNGFFQSLFNFGEVFVQTAGTVQNIEFDKAPNPQKIARIIGDKIGRRLK